MTHTSASVAFLALTTVLLGGELPTWQTPDAGNATAIAIERGTVSFEVATNMFGTVVQGKSDVLTGGTRIRETDSGLTLERLEAAVPVASLQTGIKLRDEHMRKYIFETADGQLPDVRFSADRVDCPRAQSAREYEYACTASGTLSIRGSSQPFAMPLKIERKGKGFHVTGEATLSLSDYGIERPSQLGVRTDDEVKVHLELEAPLAATTASRVR